MLNIKMLYIIFIMELLIIGGNWEHSTCSTIENWSLEIGYNSYLRQYITQLLIRVDRLLGWTDVKEGGREEGKEKIRQAGGNELSLLKKDL